MSLEYMRYRHDLVQRILAEQLTPNQVADELEREGLTAICYEEIDRYRRWGDRWDASLGVKPPAHGPEPA